MVKKIRVRIFDSLGCSVASTAVIYSLKDKFPDVYDKMVKGEVQ